MNIQEFNRKVDALFKQAAKGELTYETLKDALRTLCIRFEADLSAQGLTVEVQEIESEIVVFKKNRFYKEKCKI